MDRKIKSLLLGVSLRWKKQNGVSVQRKTEGFDEAFDRITIDTEGIEPDTLGKFLTNPEELVHWLIKHPKAKVCLGDWTVEITSDDFEDVNHEAYEHPFEISGSIEDFSKWQEDDHWVCAWSIC